MPSDLPEAPLGKFVTLEYGVSLPDANRAGTGYPVFGSNGQVGRHTQYLIEGPGIIVGRKGSAGAVTWSEEPFWPIDTTYYARVDEHCDVRWCFWMLQSLELERLDSSTGVPGLNRNDAYRILVKHPALLQQRAIARVLDAADEAIAKTEALIVKLKAIKQGFLHDLLTRGLEDNGGLRDPEKHPQEFKETSWGLMPVDWSIEPLGLVAVKVQDGTHFSPKSTAGPFRYLTSKNVRFGAIELTGCGWISEKEHRAIYSRCDVKLGDVLLTKDGANTGNAAICDLSEEVSLLSSVAFIRCDNHKLLAEYLLQYLLSPIGQRRIKDLMSGVAITRLTVEKIRNFQIPLPESNEQAEISRRLNVADRRLSTEEAYLSKLKAIKKGLMQDLLTGRVRVPTEKTAALATG